MIDTSGKLFNVNNLGLDWLDDKIDALTELVEHVKPSDFLGNRYLTRGETPMSGNMDIGLTPYWIEPLDKMDIYSDAREVAVKKGVKTSFNSTGIEGSLFHTAAHLKAFPGMFVTANKQMAQGRIKTAILPMFQNSGFDIFRSADADSTGKTGKTKDLLEWLGGGYLVPEGAKNADTMRMWSVMFLWLDELDSYPWSVGKDGDPVELLKDRCSAFWKIRKILMGSTPLWKGSSHIDIQYERGDQRQFQCRCLKCGYPMWLKFSQKDVNKPDVKRGLIWEYDSDGIVDNQSIRYECWNCGEGHTEEQKEQFINNDNAEWVPTATPAERGIYSYHMPSLLSIFQPWSKQVSAFLAAYHKNGKVKSVTKLQKFYNNVLGMSFEVGGSKLPFRAASGHRRKFYGANAIPNTQITQYCPSHVMFLAMTVDVQKHYLSVSVWGFTVGSNPWLIEYKEVKDDSELGTQDLESPAWSEVQRLIEEQEYVSDDGKTYRIAITGIDCGYQEEAGESVVLDFCDGYDSGVYPIKGDSHSSKRQKTFMEFKTGSKATGYMLAVDMYKDRMATALRREWRPEYGDQPRFHINLHNDVTDDEIKQLTKEYKREETQKNGAVLWKWHRPKGSKNELWDLLIYAMAMLDILAFEYCTLNMELKETDWPLFWAACEEDEPFYISPDK
jgi:phage terminase large subunit GpA-like protein